MKKLIVLWSILASTAFADGMCEGCHGPKGRSSVDYIPNLAGQKETYLYNQLKDYKSGKRKGTMSGIVAGMSDDKLKELAKYFSKQECK